MNMKDKLNEYYRNPDKKFCFYTGGGNPEVAKKLGVKRWDWTPEKPLIIEPWYGDTHTIPMALGCEKIYTSEGKEWIAPRVKNIEDIKNIEIPEVYSGRTGTILKEIKKLKEKHPEKTIRFPDIQSPLGVAELMWDESFYMSLLTNPDEIHVLLQKITDFVIAYVKELQNVLGEHSNPACFPQVWSDPAGYYIADDTNSMVSPEMHLDYSVKYINKITEAVGPLHYHSCTWLPQYYENIKQVKNTKSKNWAIIVSADPAEIIREFSGTDFLSPHIHLDMHKERGITELNKNLNSEYDVVKYLLDNMQENTSLYLHLYDDLVNDLDKITRIYGLLDEHGYSPRANGFD